MTKRRRNYDNEYRYDITVTSWEAHVSFNDYAYINIFDCEPYQESAYISLCGTLASTGSKKLKKGTPAEVVLHPTTSYERFDWEKRDLPIGDVIIKLNPKTLIARIRIPMRSYDLIKSYMSYKPTGEIDLVGTEISRRRADIFYLCFNSKKF